MCFLLNNPLTRSVMDGFLLAELVRAFGSAVASSAFAAFRDVLKVDSIVFISALWASWSFFRSALT